LYPNSFVAGQFCIPSYFCSLGYFCIPQQFWLRLAMLPIFWQAIDRISSVLLSKQPRQLAMLPIIVQTFALERV